MKPDQERLSEQEFARPSEEEERRALIWLVDVRTHGGPLERRFAATTIDTLAWFEGNRAELVERVEQAAWIIDAALTSVSENDYCFICDCHPSHGHAEGCALEALSKDA